MHATEPALPEAPKTLRGKYLLEDRLGEGGMAVVWRARHLLVERTVAIKMLRPEVARLPNVPQRFVQEARAAWLIDHPNVVSVLDVDVDDDGTPFIVQELLDGEDLEAHLARVGPLTPAALVALVAPALDALAAAHARGVIHRDLKPSNVFLARTSRGLMPKLLDFGISRIASDDARMTSTGVVMGTPAYMAPEQVHSPKKVDSRADLWAFGVMCYELLSGKLPFDGESPGELLVKICTCEPRPLSEAVRGVPLALEALVMACLRRDPAARPASAGALYEQLRALEAGGALVTVAADDISTAATFVGHRPELPPGAMVTAIEGGLVAAAPANDARTTQHGPANDDAPAPTVVSDAYGPANDDARRAARTAPLVTEVAAPRRTRAALVASLITLGVLAGAAVAWRMNASPVTTSRRAAAPTPVVMRAPTPAPAAAPTAAPVPVATSVLQAPVAPAPAPSSRPRAGRRERPVRASAPAAQVIAPPLTPVVAPPPAVVTPEPPVVRPPPSAPPAAAQDRRVRYTTDYGP